MSKQINGAHSTIHHEDLLHARKLGFGVFLFYSLDINCLIHVIFMFDTSVYQDTTSLLAARRAHSHSANVIMASTTFIKKTGMSVRLLI